jgi:hypothetical protein
MSDKKDKKLAGTISKLAEGYPLLGMAVTYRCKSSLTIDHEKLQELLTEVGIDANLACKPLPKNAFLRVVRAKAKGRDSFARKIIDDAGRAASVILQEDVDHQNVSVDLQTRTTVEFDKENKTIKTTGEGAVEMEKGYQRYLGEYAADQFRTVANKHIKRNCKGIPMRDGGGLYFIPATLTHELDKLDALFEKFGDAADLSIIPIIDTKQAKKEMWKSLTAEVTGELQKMKKDMGKLDDEITERSMEARLRKYKTLKAKVEMYEMLFNQTAVDMKKDLEELTKAVKHKLMA